MKTTLKYSTAAKVSPKVKGPKTALRARGRVRARIRFFRAETCMKLKVGKVQVIIT